MRKAINFFRSYYEVAMELNDKDRLAFYDALLSKQFENIEPKLSGMAKFAYLSQKHSIDAQLKGYYDKTKDTNFQPIVGGMVAPCQGGSVGGMVAPTVQEKEKEKEKEVNNTIPSFIDFLSYADTKKPNVHREHLKSKYDAWVENGWKDGNDKKITNWKSKLLNTLPYIPTMNTEEETVEQMNDRMLYENVMKKLQMYNAKG